VADLLHPFQVDANDHVGGFADDAPLMAHLVMNGVKKQKRVNIGQRTALPFLNLWQHFIGDVGDKSRRDFDAVELLKMVLNLAAADSLGVQGKNL